MKIWKALWPHCADFQGSKSILQPVTSTSFHPVTFLPFSHVLYSFHSIYIYLNSKRLASLDNRQFYWTGFWAVWTKQPRFLPRPARKESNVPKIKKQLRSNCLTYILWLLSSCYFSILRTMFWQCFSEILKFVNCIFNLNLYDLLA